jgi:hypothetical protein
MGWTPPITIVRQMSPSQIDGLRHQIRQQLEQVHRWQEHGWPVLAASGSALLPRQGIPAVAQPFDPWKFAGASGTGP